VIEEEEVPDNGIDDYFSDDEPWTKTAMASLHVTPKPDIVTDGKMKTFSHVALLVKHANTRIH